MQVASAPPVARPAAWRVWLHAVRPFSSTASAVPILVGSALAAADRAFAPLRFAVVLVASAACHAGAIPVNDCHHHRRDTDTAASLSPSGVIQRSLLSPAQVRRGMLAALGLATLLGLGIVTATGWPVLVAALACLGDAYLYTGGSKPSNYVALGQVAVFLAIVFGAHYVLAGQVTAPAVLASLSVGLLVAAILHASNIRDIGPDGAAGKATLVTRFGRGIADAEYPLLVAAAYPAPLALVATTPCLLRAVRGSAAPSTLNRVLRGTAGHHLRFGLLPTAGLLAASLPDRLP